MLDICLCKLLYYLNNMFTLPNRCQNCPNLTCRNGGTCIRENGKEKCLCPPGYHGKLCEQDTCFQHCQNGGTCMKGSKQPSCVCSPYFSGRRCEIDLCAGPSPPDKCELQCACKNGGICEVVNGGQLCRCGDVWGGLKCEVRLITILNNNVM